jgi:hypothetical protein
MEKKSYLFCWDAIPGNHNRRLVEFLNQEFDINLKIPIITKIDHHKTINVYFDENIISLKLNDFKTKVELFIDSKRNEELQKIFQTL